MKFLLDENIPFSVMSMLKELGLEVEHVREVGLRGKMDKIVAEYAKRHEAVLMTKDVEFGNLLLYPKNTHYGLLVLRLPHFFTAKQIMESVRGFLTKINPEELKHTLTVLEVGKYRMRKLV